MKKFTIGLITTILAGVSCFAAEWQDHWEKAVEYCTEKKYGEAETEFNLSISALEHSQDYFHPHVYVDRARLYLLQDRYKEALEDLNIALDSPHLKDHDRIRGLVTRILTCSNLQMEEQVWADYEEFKSISTDFPKAEFTEDKVIVRNVPKGNCYRNITKAFLVASKICESEEDIRFLDSGIMIAKRKRCECECRKPNNEATTLKSVEDCNWYCDKAALVGMGWCSRVFKLWKCQTGCIFAVDLIKDGWHWCCKDGNFYKKCIGPFEDILSYMRQPCEPYWD